MNKIQPRLGGQLFSRVSQYAFPGRIGQLEVSIETGDAKHVARKLKQVSEFFVGAYKRWIGFLFCLGRHFGKYTAALTIAQAQRRMLRHAGEEARTGSR